MSAPKFRKWEDGRLRVDYTAEAHRIKAENSKRPVLSASVPQKVRAAAEEEVKRKGGCVSNEMQVLAAHRLQFGAFRGQTFSWMLENALSYVGWLIGNMQHEKKTTAPLSVNKFLFKEFVESFKDGRDVVTLYMEQEREKKDKAKTKLKTKPSTIQPKPSIPSTTQPKPSIHVPSTTQPKPSVHVPSTTQPKPSIPCIETGKFLVHLSRRLKCTIVIMRCPWSIVVNFSHYVMWPFGPLV